MNGCHPRFSNGRFGLAALLCLGATTTGVAQDACPTEATTSRATTVHSSPPRFYTGRGWLIEAPMDTLAAGTRVSICERSRIGVIPATRLWVRVRYESASEGWISADAVDESGSEPIATAALFATPVFQAPPLEPLDAAKLVPVTDGAPNPAWSYAWMLVAVLLGMIAKAVFDRLECDEFDMRTCLRQTARAFVVAPIVFLGIGEAGNFPLAGSGMLLYLAWAFQNGFFWQTVLGRPTAEAPSGMPVPRPVRTPTATAAAAQPGVRGLSGAEHQLGVTR